MNLLGIDIGGSGIKGAVVDTQSGELLQKRVRLETPDKPVPEQVLRVVGQLCERLPVDGPIGCGFPGVIRGQRILTAVNLHESWVGVDFGEMIERELGRPAWLLNDADAAGLAEFSWGAGKGRKGLVIVLTIGTGIGTAFFSEGRLLANTEIGHIKMLDKGSGKITTAEQYVSDLVRKRDDLKWPDWGKRLNRYLKYLDSLFWPELFILGGGVAKKFDKFAGSLKLETEVVPAQLLNQAGIAGAALAARQNLAARAAP